MTFQWHTNCDQFELDYTVFHLLFVVCFVWFFFYICRRPPLFLEGNNSKGE